MDRSSRTPLLQRLRANLVILREESPGFRFQAYHRRHEANRRGRLILGAAGVLLMVTGLATYPIPGPPSTLMVCAGALCASRASHRAARGLDGLELRVRRRLGRHRARREKVSPPPRG